MQQALQDEINGFIETLSNAKRTTNRVEFSRAYTKALEMAESLLINDTFDENTFSGLQRYVSDCLPWTDDVLNAWERVARRRLADRDSAKVDP